MLVLGATQRLRKKLSAKVLDGTDGDQVFVAPQATHLLLFPRMFSSRLLPLVALAGLILVFTSCERHHPGEIPDLQKEHFNPLEAGSEAAAHAESAAPAASATPANFFPPQKP